MLTQNVLDGLTDESLKQQVYPEGSISQSGAFVT
jgi:hypothetical protein